MKTIHHIGNHLTRGALVLAVAGLALLGNHAQAQEKGAEQLMKLSRPQKAPAAAVMSAHKACAKCQDVVVRVPDRDAKGAQVLAQSGHATKAVMRHQCPGCSTKIVTDGVGKKAKDTAKHVCTESGAAGASCCATK